MNMITSKNRTPAKRLLNAFYDSTEVRMMTLAQLNAALQRAINSGLVTEEGARRALNIKSKMRGSDGYSHEGKGREENAEREESDNFSEATDDGKDETDNKGDNKGDGDSQSNEKEQQDADNGDGEQESEQSEQESESKGDKEQQDKQDGDSEEQEDKEQEKQEEQSEEEQQQANEEQQQQQEEEQEEEDDDKPLRHEMFQTILKWIAAGVNVALVGPAGSGKSTIVQHVCEELDKEFRGCGALMSKYDLIGYKDANGMYHATPLHEAFTEGHVFCFDELDASAPDAVVSFNAATDNQNVFSFPCGMEQKHEEFIAVCCMNTWGNGATSDYVGRFKQDAAAMSRFVKVRVGYDRKIEARIAGKKNLDIAQRVWDLRDSCDELGIRHVVSTRMIVQAVAGRDAKCTKAEIDRDVLFAGLDDGAIRQVKSAMNIKAKERK